MWYWCGITPHKNQPTINFELFSYFVFKCINQTKLTWKFWIISFLCWSLELHIVRSLRRRIWLCFPPKTTITIIPTQILQLRTLAKALLVYLDILAFVKGKESCHLYYEHKQSPNLFFTNILWFIQFLIVQNRLVP